MNNNNLRTFEQYFWFKRCFIIKVIFAIFKTCYRDFLEMFQPPQKQQAVGSLIVYRGSATLHHCLENTEKYPMAHPWRG